MRRLGMPTTRPIAALVAPASGSARKNGIPARSATATV
jgi:hypothetical protein